MSSKPYSKNSNLVSSFKSTLTSKTNRVIPSERVNTFTSSATNFSTFKASFHASSGSNAYFSKANDNGSKYLPTSPTKKTPENDYLEYKLNKARERSQGTNQSREPSIDGFISGKKIITVRSFSRDKNDKLSVSTKVSRPSSGAKTGASLKLEHRRALSNTSNLRKKESIDDLLDLKKSSSTMKSLSQNKTNGGLKPLPKESNSKAKGYYDALYRELKQSEEKRTKPTMNKVLVVNSTATSTRTVQKKPKTSETDTVKAVKTITNTEATAFQKEVPVAAANLNVKIPGYFDAKYGSKPVGKIVSYGANTNQGIFRLIYKKKLQRG